MTPVNSIINLTNRDKQSTWESLVKQLRLRTWEAEAKAKRKDSH
jgi:hypothetical protein